MLCGFVYTYHPAAAGSNPKHTIYAFSIYIIDIVMTKGRNKQKEAGIGPFLKNLSNNLFNSSPSGTSDDPSDEMSNPS